MKNTILKPGAKVRWTPSGDAYSVVEWQPENGIGGAYWLKNAKGESAVASPDEVEPLGIRWTFKTPVDASGRASHVQPKQWHGETDSGWSFVLLHRRGEGYRPIATHVDGRSVTLPKQTGKDEAVRVCEDYLEG